MSYAQFKDWTKPSSLAQINADTHTQHPCMQLYTLHSCVTQAAMHAANSITTKQLHSMQQPWTHHRPTVYTTPMQMYRNTPLLCTVKMEVFTAH